MHTPRWASRRVTLSRRTVRRGGRQAAASWTAAPSSLDPDPLSLAAYRFPQIRHLFADDVVDRFPRRVDVLADGIGNIVERKVVDELSTPFACHAIPASGSLAGPSRAFASLLGHPPCSGRGLLARPACAFQPGESRVTRAAPSSANHRTNRTASARARSKEESHCRTDRCAEKRRRQQIELLLAILIIRVVRHGGGRAGAASPTLARLQGICHLRTPPFRMLHEFQCAPRAK